MQTLLIIFVSIFIGRYLIQVLDHLLELFEIIIAKACNKIQIDVSIMTKEYQMEYENTQELSPAIGFHTGVSESQFEEVEDRKIGF